MMWFCGRGNKYSAEIQRGNGTGHPLYLYPLFMTFDSHDNDKPCSSINEQCCGRRMGPELDADDIYTEIQPVHR